MVTIQKSLEQGRVRWTEIRRKGALSEDFRNSSAQRWDPAPVAGSVILVDLKLILERFEPVRKQFEQDASDGEDVDFIGILERVKQFRRSIAWCSPSVTGYHRPNGSAWLSQTEVRNLPKF